MMKKSSQSIRIADDKFQASAAEQDTAIVWLRRDLRLADHSALQYAITHHARVLLCYLHAPDEQENWLPGGASLWWLQCSLSALQQTCLERGGACHVLTGNLDSQSLLELLIEHYEVDAVYWHRRYEPSAIDEDKRIRAALESRGITVKSFPGYLFVEPWSVVTQSGTPYQVYTPFARKLMTSLATVGAPLPAPEASLMARTAGFNPSEISGIEAVDVAQQPLLAHFPDHDSPWFAKLANHWRPGEVDAHRRLSDFIAHDLPSYAIARDFPAQAGTSKLSPSLHFGELSPRQVLVAVYNQEASRPSGDHTEIYIKELLWREFSQHCLYHFPALPSAPKQDKFIDMPWQHNPDWVERWQRGMTGIPIVDAGMRELWQTGVMHNRVRMLVASLFTKNMNQPWQVGERWFWDTLVDANLANNSQGWQWTAGCGVDAAPYFRIFNPVTQAKKFDPEGEYLARYVPELNLLPLRYRFAPWGTPRTVYKAAGFVLGRDYPEPIVDLQTSRAEALSRFKALG